MEINKLINKLNELLHHIAVFKGLEGLEKITDRGRLEKIADIMGKIADTEWAKKVDSIIRPQKLEIISLGRYQTSRNFYERLFFGPGYEEFRSFDELFKILLASKRMYHHHSQILAQETFSQVRYYLPINVFHIRSVFRSDIYDKSQDPFEVFPGTKDISEKFMSHFNDFLSSISNEVSEYLKQRPRGLNEDEYERERNEYYNWYSNLMKKFDANDLEEQIRRHEHLALRVRNIKDRFYPPSHFDILVTTKDDFKTAKSKVDQVGRKYIVQRSVYGSASM